MSIYKKAIAIHGLFVLCIAVLFLIGGAWYGLHRVRTVRRDIQKTAEESRQLGVELEVARAKLQGRVENMQAWDKCLHGEVVQLVTKALQEVMEPYQENELKQIALGRPTNRSGLGGSTENSYSRFEVVFEGGFGPMQEVLAQLETRMPNLVLEELLIEPSRNATVLSFRAIFTCWSSGAETA